MIAINMIAITALDTHEKLDLQAGAVRGNTSFVSKRISPAMTRRREVGGFCYVCDAAAFHPHTRVTAVDRTAAFIILLLLEGASKAYLLAALEIIKR